MESPRRRRGGAEQPTCWSSVVRFPPPVFAAHPRRGRARLGTTRPAVKTRSRDEPRPTPPVDPSASDVSASPGRFPSRTPLYATRAHYAHPTKRGFPQLKVLCCVDVASAETARRRDSGGTVSSDDHASPLVAQTSASSSGDVLPRFRAPTPPPFESRANGSPETVDRRADGGVSAGETSGEDDLRRDSESSRCAASDGERDHEPDGSNAREGLWREKRGLLRKSHASSHASGHASHDAGHPATTSSARRGEKKGTPARRRSFDGETARREDVASDGKKKTHHRAESEPVPSRYRYVPPRLDDAACETPEQGEADDLVSSLRKKNSAFGAADERNVKDDGNVSSASEAFKEHLKKTVLLGQHARSASGVSVTSTLCDEDSCPTCFEAYDAENPKMPLVCGHHFHLACVYEWYERSDKCPVCEAKMEFDPSTGWSLEG